MTNRRDFLKLGALATIGGLVVARAQQDPPGTIQPLAPGQRSAAPLPQLPLDPTNPNLVKIEYASNGFIEVAHALLLVPKTEDALVQDLRLAQQAVAWAFSHRTGLSEVDVSVYQRESYAGFGGPMPRLTASVLRASRSEFMALNKDNITKFSRAWVNPSSLKSPKRAPLDVRELDPNPSDGMTDEEAAKGGVLFRGSPRLEMAALTFDDSPHPLYEPLLLDVLRRVKVKATFFCIGRNAKAHPYFVQDMVADGHEIGNHTYHHVRLPGLDPNDVRDELEEANKVLSGITGKPIRYFRPPGGDYTRQTLRISSELGLTTVFWTDDPGDFDNLGQRTLENRLQRRLYNGGIVLLHDNVLQSIMVLPRFYANAKTRGIRLDTVAALADAGGK
jgi:peptidoglycan-N-acetylglucosamine deacetylase